MPGVLKARLHAYGGRGLDVGEIVLAEVRGDGQPAVALICGNGRLGARAEISVDVSAVIAELAQCQLESANENGLGLALAAGAWCVLAGALVGATKALPLPKKTMKLLLPSR